MKNVNDDVLKSIYNKLMNEFMENEKNLSSLKEGDSCCNRCDDCKNCEEDSKEDSEESLKQTNYEEIEKDLVDSYSNYNDMYCKGEFVNETKLPKKVLFFTSSGTEKVVDDSIDVAVNKAKMFDSKPITLSTFIQIDKDCEIKNSFTGATLEDSTIYNDMSWMSFVSGTEIEIFDTIGILELKDRKSENKFIFVKNLRNTKTEENSLKKFDEIERIENYLMNIYDKAFSNDFELINTYIASESIELDKYPKTKPVIIAGIQLIN